MSTHTLVRMRKLKKSNRVHYHRIIDDFVARIKKQGCGCNVPGYGASYYNNINKTYDPFGLALGFNNVHRNYGVISGEEQKPIVRKMSRLFRVNLETDKEYSAFVDFLQILQDTHDNAWDEYNHVDGSRMEKYVTDMVALKAQYPKEV